MHLTPVAVPYTLAHLKPLLPSLPARIAEAGCGQGALAVALADLGYDVTGVDRNAEMAASARERGVHVIQADINDISGEYDVVLFTRSLHHAESLDNTLAHAVTLLAPGGQIIIEEFGWERVNHTAAGFFYDNRAKLVATGLLDADIPSGEPARRLGCRPRHTPPGFRHARRPRSRRHRCDHDGHEHPVASRRRMRRSVDGAHHSGRRRSDRHARGGRQPYRRRRSSLSWPASLRPPSVEQPRTPNGPILIVSSVERIAKGKRHDALTMTTLPIDPRPATSVPVSDRPTGGSPGDQLASVGDREGRGA